MRFALVGVALGWSCWLSGCAAHQPPVPVVGPVKDVAALAGEWAGEYSSGETGRSGRISFVLDARGDTAYGDVIVLDARGDTAYGDVIMIPRGFAQQVRPWRDEAPTVVQQTRAEALTISFVRVRGNEISGVLAPYRDPECGCALTTRFVGWLAGDTISGAYFSHHERAEAEAQGRWKVIRKPRGQAEGR
jgi:hypothetical protein